MKLPGRFHVGAATHTGLVRKNNEDDYLVLAPPRRKPAELVAAVADGMGGVAGGAEASRAGLRGLAAGLLAGPPPGGDAPAEATAGTTAAAMAAAFAEASARVHEQAQQIPALKDMGTTLTAVAFANGRAVLGHVGDSRAYLWRDGALQQLTEDHASREHKNRLLRCIGAGQTGEVPDVREVAIEAGDRLLLCTDGVWGIVAEPQLKDLLGRLPPQAAAEQLLRLALHAGAPDNATAVVVHVAAAAARGTHEVELPAEETPSIAELMRPPGRLGAPRWPWFLLALALALVAASAVRWTTGFDLLLWLRTLWG